MTFRFTAAGFHESNKMSVDLLHPRGVKIKLTLKGFGKKVKMKQVLSVTFICNGLLLYLVEGLPVRADFKHFRFRIFEIFLRVFMRLLSINLFSKLL